MTAGRIWAASLAVVLGSLAVVAVWHHPALFLWYLAVAAFVVIAALAIASDHFRHERDEARAELDHRADVSDELVSAVAVAESLALELSHADATIRNLAAKAAVTYVGDKGTRLRLVDGSENEWPRIARVLDLEAGEQG